MSIVKDREFLMNVGKLFGSSFISQLIPFLILPVLTRMYTPDEFGVWAYFLSISGIFSILMSGNYEYSVMLPDKDEEAAGITAGIFFTVIISVLLLSAVFIFAGEDISRISGVTSKVFISLIPFMAGAMALFRMLNYWNNRRNRFTVTASGNITRSAAAGAVQIVSGDHMIFSGTGTGLLAGSMTGYLAGAAVQSRDLIRKIRENKDCIRPSLVMRMMRRYKDFPKYFMFSELLNFVSSNVPVLFLTNLFSAASAGLYSIPHKFINTPLAMLGSSVSQVYFRKTSREGLQADEFGDLTADVFKKLFILGIVPLTFTAAFGDIIFTFLLGKEWAVSGIYASLLSPWMLAVFAASPVSIAFAKMEKQKTGLKLNSLLVSIRIISFLAGAVIFRSAFAAVMLFGFSGFIYWLYFTFFLMKTVGYETKIIKLFIIKYLGAVMLPVLIIRSLLYYV